ncbi:response regulator transcription factor [Aneurinibacillus aneurinilyticus]|jgi:DNA-binding response OmpR family regulator|uniref:Response regulator transcription factor n=2 Tax=Aneurinibacillus aneurinilyticus TaxID=1391 RepID=A0A848D2I9_ANEAE|nr:response regulator transcription factor [Aneurinibacillus aneurinilyticus]ERI09511.1 response regulator receiver domain protein [Aneurinibacillus aneurinilyticus ATCC 12856]MCI1695711.1 response regulator transcription factor [Aneurinibacillus aneurinilyticus]MED0706683.1 response regulator transcription factor [Aneurinibacillus aneurinilyticus]MED0722557.1 response regulator transcription factor [Aneurinibacillus aneurinilyticus]MED0730501.1 response regulator transcription factor [Aneurin
MMNAAHILVVEDDLEICGFVVEALRRDGYRVTFVHDGQSAIQAWEGASFDLVILDIMLPGIDGLEVLRRIREKERVPVLLLSAKDGEVDKILGLGGGADDYLTKPFLLGELLARVKAQLRRYLYYQSAASEASPAVIAYRQLELNPNTYEVKVDGTSRPLTAKEFEILKLLLSEPRRVFTKSQIFERVWGETYSSEVDENTVMVHIRRLRQKIEADASRPQYIQTIWGIGYRLGGED